VEGVDRGVLDPVERRPEEVELLVEQDDCATIAAMIATTHPIGVSAAMAPVADTSTRPKAVANSGRIAPISATATLMTVRPLESRRNVAAIRATSATPGAERTAWKAVTNNPMAPMVSAIAGMRTRRRKSTKVVTADDEKVSISAPATSPRRSISALSGSCVLAKKALIFPALSRTFW
jgi:hypothetical protein